MKTVNLHGGFLSAVLWEAVFSGRVFGYKHHSTTLAAGNLESTLATWPKMRSLRHTDKLLWVTSCDVSATLQWLSAPKLLNVCKERLVTLWFGFATDQEHVHSYCASANRRSFLFHFHPAWAHSILLVDLTGPVYAQPVDGWKLVSIISHFPPVWRTAWQCVCRRGSGRCWLAESLGKHPWSRKETLAVI